MHLKAALALLVLVPLLAGAAPRFHDMLIGEWHSAEGNLSCTYTFRADGTFAGEVSQNSKVIWHFVGHWSVSGDKIHYQYIRSSPDVSPAPDKDEDKLVEISPIHFVVLTSDGSRRTYKRVGDHH